MQLNPELWSLFGIPLLIFLARVMDVSLGTMRIILVSRGHRRVAPLIGFVEILVWLVAIGQVVQNLDRPLNYFAYAGGYATGTWVGLFMDGKLALGLVAVRIITRKDAEELIGRLREGQFGVTSVAARGLTGRVRLIFTVVRRRDLQRIMEVIRAHNPQAFVSVSDVRMASEGYFSVPGSTYPRLLEMLRKK
jgi:uncharacterized protein YebE (UPF0316 family)